MGYLKYYLSHFRSPFSLIRAPLVVLLITGLPSHASAREQAGADGDTATRLENIIVTATKRSRDLQGIIGAGMAVSGAEIEQRNLVTSEELFNNITGLQMQDYGGFAAQPTVMIRGVGTDRPEYENSAQIVNDGLALGDSIMTHFPLFDVEQVEVLRGPQSTALRQKCPGRHCQHHQPQTRKPV